MKLREALKGKLTEKEQEKLITGYDIVGDIAILEIPHGLGKKEGAIAEAVMKINPSVKVVVKKVGIHSGKYRLQDYKVIAGEKRTETIHTENGVRVKLDIAKAYCSNRPVTKRLRIAS